ncbi:MAG: hypothetical protein ABI758_04130 [Candidatus Woesebacteria bacterium]
MKKISLFIVSILLFSACKPSATVSTPEGQTTPEVKNETSVDVNALIASGKPAKCEISKTDGSMHMTSWVMGKKMKTTGITTSTKTQYDGAMISDGTYMYTWDQTKKEGVKMKIPSEQDLKDLSAKTGQDIPNMADSTNRQKWMDQGYTVNCSAADISESEFVPPTDVTFTDASAMMDSVNQMMKQNNTGTAPSAAQQKEMQDKAQEMMKQYQQQ